MKAKKGLLGLPKGLSIAFKVFMILLGFLVLCCVPLLGKDSITDAFQAYGADAPNSAQYAGADTFQTLFVGFVVVLGVMLIVNIIFFIIDETLNDTVAIRRNIQIALNILIIICGVVVMLYLAQIVMPGSDWWSSILLTTQFQRAFAWGPAAVFAVCGLIQMVWDVYIFCGQNRVPVYHKRLAKKATL